MPNCFQLLRKSSPDEGPVLLPVIDEELCKHFQTPVDPKYWFNGWYDTIGFPLAMGQTFESIITGFKEDLKEATTERDAYWVNQINIAQYLNEHFTVRAWAIYI